MKKNIKRKAMKSTLKTSADQSEMLTLIGEARANIDRVADMMKSDETMDDEDITYVDDIHHTAVEALADLDTYARQF